MATKKTSERVNREPGLLADIKQDIHEANLSEKGLRELSQYVVGRVNNMIRDRVRVSAEQFQVGQDVEFDSKKKGRVVTLQIYSITPSGNIKGRGDDAVLWTVAASLCRPVSDSKRLQMDRHGLVAPVKMPGKARK